MDSRPKAPWRRRSVDHAAKQTPCHGDSLPRQVSRKPSDDVKRFPSLRKPHRLPTPQNSQSTKGSSGKSRSKSMFSLRRKKSDTTLASSIGAHTGMAVHGCGGQEHCAHDHGARRGRGMRHMLLRTKAASSGEMNHSATESLTDRDADADYIIDHLPADLARKMDLRNAEDNDNHSHGSHGSRSLKDRRMSLHLTQIFGRSSRFNIMGHSSRSGNSSLLSSLSSAFSSMRSGVFVFTTTNSDRRLAEQEGHSLPAFIGDDQGEWELTRAADHHDCQMHPPQIPSRRDSLSTYQSHSWSHQSKSYHSYSHSSSSPQLMVESPKPMPGGACRLGVDGVPMRPGRRNSIGTPIEAIAEVENEVDLSSHFSVAGTDATALKKPGFRRSGTVGTMGSHSTDATPKMRPFHRSGTRESISLPGVDEFAEDDEEEETNDENAGMNRSAPTQTVGMSEEFAEAIKMTELRRCQSAPVHALPGNDAPPSPSEELPFPVRRESITSCDTGSQSQASSARRWRRRRDSAKVPSSVSPEATIMEKKSFLRRSLHFPKQRFGAVLKRVSKSSKKEKETSSPPPKQSPAA